jgi:hypothetical protein
MDFRGIRPPGSQTNYKVGLRLLDHPNMIGGLFFFCVKSDPQPHRPITRQNSLSIPNNFIIKIIINFMKSEFSNIVNSCYNIEIN